MSNNHNHPSTSSHEPIPVSDDSSSYKLLAEAWGVNSIEPVADTTIKALRASHESGNEEDFSILLDDVTTDYLIENNPQFKTNIREMRAERDETKQIEIRDRQLALYQEAQALLLDASGISEEASKSKRDQAKETIHTRLMDASVRDGSTFDPLKELGILQEDNEGNEIFTYPAGLFPEDTDQRWVAYTTSVKRHIDASNKLIRGLASQSDVQDVDFERRIAHNAFARDLQYMLGDPGDDFEEYRKLAMKMREQRFPSVETDEKARTNLMIGETVTHALRLDLLPPDAIYGGDDRD